MHSLPSSGVPASPLRSSGNRSRPLKRLCQDCLLSSEQHLFRNRPKSSSTRLLARTFLSFMVTSDHSSKIASSGKTVDKSRPMQSRNEKTTACVGKGTELFIQNRWQSGRERTQDQVPIQCQLLNPSTSYNDLILL
ncbi:hypothetical protein MPTK1_6g20870 [Marchantia polymorpha subsp. ruderalis]|uniref:Uncharacterized protein n=2 Tax=Marchantia polymorpha TaxID=3197 RepID=A0AAF6BUB0_MARPO|nr:hypothetical protein MARPO_0091s0068 [Marchantia polymorpha]BBN15594.1 hypothetical protein Mp_6g20870 [Marchantia polymorpha subsp. ruderalis]|eukprot:PTQ33224.1 hypothetical protein MARPO_0091s0068 [Marchantia polymorpha]